MDSTDNLVSGLVEDLMPVKPVLPVRVASATVLALAAAIGLLVLWPQQSARGMASLFVDATYTLTALGFLAILLGGSVSALAASRPGREALEARGRMVSLAGLVLAASACGLALAQVGATLSSPTSQWDAMCFSKALKLSIAPILVVGAFVVRGFTHAPHRAALMTLAAAGAIGGGVIHLSCGLLVPQHLLLGHLSAPIALAAIGFYPLSLLLRRLDG